LCFLSLEHIFHIICLQSVEIKADLPFFGLLPIAFHRFNASALMP